MDTWEVGVARQSVQGAQDWDAHTTLTAATPAHFAGTAQLSRPTRPAGIKKGCGRPDKPSDVGLQLLSSRTIAFGAAEGILGFSSLALSKGGRCVDAVMSQGPSFGPADKLLDSMHELLIA